MSDVCGSMTLSLFEIEKRSACAWRGTGNARLCPVLAALLRKYIWSAVCAVAGGTSSGDGARARSIRCRPCSMRRRRSCWRCAGISMTWALAAFCRIGMPARSPSSLPFSRTWLWILLQASCVGMICTAAASHLPFAVGAENTPLMPLVAPEFGASFWPIMETEKRLSGCFEFQVEAAAYSVPNIVA